MTRNRAWAPWVGFGCVVLACLVFAVGAGVWIVRATEPRQLGTSAVGEWADLSEQGLRVRIDDVTSAPSFPSSYDTASDMAAPEGFEFLRVRMTVELATGPDEGVSCLLRLRNRLGEVIENKDYGVDGPGVSDCNLVAAAESMGRPLERNDQFQSQSVFIVLPDDVDSFTLDVVPLFGEDEVFWRFELG